MHGLECYPEKKIEFGNGVVVFAEQYDYPIVFGALGTVHEGTNKSFQCLLSDTSYAAIATICMLFT